MMNALKAKKKRKPLKTKMVKNVRMVITLSDRLKQAGIKECESDNERKINQNLSNTFKTRYNKPYCEKYTKASSKSVIKARRKHRDIPKNLILSSLKDLNQTEATKDDVPPKPQEESTVNLDGSAKETIYVSLDFLKDCQKYRSKFRNPKIASEFKYQQKNVKFITTRHKQYAFMKKDSKKSLEVNRIQWRNKQENLITNALEDKKIEILTDNSSSQDVNDENKNSTQDPKTEPGRKVAKTFLPVQPSQDIKDSEVAKIDKKYLETLLSITTNKDTEDKTKTAQDESNEETGENQNNKKKKITGKDFFENKRKNKLEEEKYQKNGIENKVSSLGIKNDSTTIAGSAYKDRISIRIVRDSTKSELQIKLKKENPSKQRDSEMKSEKNVTHIKSKINDSQRKRKTRNIILKNQNEKFIESPFSGEVSKVADVKELWRRETSEKSENSLSSHSSSTIPDTDDLPEWKNLGLESYKVLEKLVDEEVKKMTKKSENKNNMGDVNNQINTKTDQIKKESDKTKTDFQKLQFLKPDLTGLMDLNQKEENILKKRLKEAERQQFFSTYEGEKPKSQLLNFLSRDNSKLKLLSDKEHKSSKIPSQIIKQWSILNRLEQAFLALGTPTFPNRGGKDLTRLKSKNLTGSEKNTTDTETKKNNSDKKLRKVKKSKDTLKNENKNSINVLCSNPSTSTKITIQNYENKKDKIGPNLLKDKLTRVRSVKGPKTGSIGGSTILVKISEDKENCPTLKKKELHKPLTLSVVGKSKLIDSKPPRHLKKKPQELKFHSNDPVPKLVKIKDLCKKISSKILEQSTTSEEFLERKNTFDIITVKKQLKVQPRKSKSCTKIDENSEEENTKKRFLPTKTQDFKSLSFFDENAKEKLKTRSKSTDSEQEMKTISNLRKSVIKEKSSTHTEKPRSANEKDNLKKPRESVGKIQKAKLQQDSKLEKSVEELPEQLLVKKNLNHNNLNERAIKERSILSMRGNQLTSQVPTKLMQRIQEKQTPDLLTEPKTDELPKQTNSKETTNQKVNFDGSSLSCTSTETYDLQDSTLPIENIESTNEVDVTVCQKYLSDISEILSSLSSLSISVYSDQTNDELNKKDTPTLWEQDIHYYHEIVKEIMSQYQRLDGFLKQSENTERISGSNSIKLMIAKDEITNNSHNFQNMDIHEYRKKIMLEYETLPFFEYKTKLQQKKEENLTSEEPKKRNLSVVKDLTEEMDLDVKDYQPKIHKVLGSQLYVDLENLSKRNCVYVKCKDKKSSLQDIILSKNEKTVQQEECLRTNSMPKAFLQLPETIVPASSSQRFKSSDSSQGDFSSVFTSGTYLEDTESETL